MTTIIFALLVAAVVVGLGRWLNSERIGGGR